MPLAANEASPSAKAFFEEATDTFAYLYGRWQDEKDYEDIADYALPLKPHAEKHNVQIISMTKRPFGCKFTVDGRTYAVEMKARSYSYRRIA